MAERRRGPMGVAISTTAEPHRLDFLRQSVRAWREALSLGSVIVVTVDGSDEDLRTAQEVMDTAGPEGSCGGIALRVGQPLRGGPPASGRMGVAANKNTGIEFLMDSGVEHIFLCDDDTWPKSEVALDAHINASLAHSMVCWGSNRLLANETGVRYAEWGWPRGVMLYVRDSVVKKVGGMDERFGLGGHEHAEWSRRIFNAGLTPVMFGTPSAYAMRNATGASMLWHAEDMPLPGEAGPQWSFRKQRNTTLNGVTPEQRQTANRLLDAEQNSAGFKPFRAKSNGRSYGTLSSATEKQTEETQK